MTKEIKDEIKDTVLDMFSAIAKNNKIRAIKAIRELTGIGLKEAKGIIDEVWTITTGCCDVGGYNRLKDKNTDLQIEIKNQKQRVNVLKTAFSRVVDSI